MGRVAPCCRNFDQLAAFWCLFRKLRKNEKRFDQKHHFEKIELFDVFLLVPHWATPILYIKFSIFGKNIFFFGREVLKML